MLMEVNKSLCNWLGDIFKSLFRQGMILFGIRSKWLVTKMLHDDVNCIISLKRINDFDNVWMWNVFKYFDLLDDSFLFLLGVHFELFIGFNNTGHSIIFSISISNFGKSSLSNDLIENVILMLYCFRIFNGWKFKVFLMFGNGFWMANNILDLVKFWWFLYLKRGRGSFWRLRVFSGFFSILH